MAVKFPTRPLPPLGAQRRPRAEREDYLAFVRRLPCVVCGRPDHVQAAHVRYPSYKHGKTDTGVGRKPDDRWAVPLCESHHLLGPDAQHGYGEREWWESKKIDPLVIAALLYSYFNVDDEYAASLVAISAREICRRME